MRMQMSKIKMSTAILTIASAVAMSSASVMADTAKGNVPAGNVGINWKIDKFLGQHPGNGLLTDLTFMFKVNDETLHQKGTYFAQQFYFDNPGTEGNTAYTGLQPQPDKDGKQYLRAVFSSFIAKTKSTDKNCSDGADGGAGVSCGVVFPATYGHTYKIHLTKTDAHTWSGDVEDEQTSQRVHIGSWSLADHIGNIKPSGIGFAEYYAYYESGYPQFVVPECSRLAKISVLYGPVSTTNYGGGAGSVSGAYEYNSKECKGVASGYSVKTVDAMVTFPGDKKIAVKGQEVQRGFVSVKP